MKRRQDVVRRLQAETEAKNRAAKQAQLLQAQQAQQVAPGMGGILNSPTYQPQYLSHLLKNAADPAMQARYAKLAGWGGVRSDVPMGESSRTGQQWPVGVPPRADLGFNPNDYAQQEAGGGLGLGALGLGALGLAGLGGLGASAMGYGPDMSTFAQYFPEIPPLMPLGNFSDPSQFNTSFLQPQNMSYLQGGFGGVTNPNPMDFGGYIGY